MEPAVPPNPTPTGTDVERGFQKAILRLVKGGAERLAIEAGQIDAIIDPGNGNAILLPAAQRALIERKTGFRSLIGLAFDWYWELDDRYRFVSHRGAAGDGGGPAEESIIGKTLWELPIDNMSESDWRTHRQQLEWRAVFRDLEIRHLDRAGTVRYLSITGEPVFDDRNQFKGYRGITRDITERRQAALAREPHRFEPSILDALVAPIAVLDQAGTVLSSNQAWRVFADSHCGVGRGVAVGSNYLAVCEDACGTEQVDGKAIAAGIRQVIAGERALFRYDYACESPAGRSWFALSVTATTGYGNACAVVSCEDMTERKYGELLLELEFTVARCLADAVTATAALQSVIRVICETQGWDCGRYFRADRAAGVLCFVESWGIRSAVIERFLEKSRGMVFRPGAGLAGRVYQSGQPLWILDSGRGAGSPTALAPETGENGAFVFPVEADDKVIGVLAFSSSKIREPDDRMLKAVHSVGDQLGRFLLRQQVVDALRRSELRYRTLNDLTSDWYWEQDSHFRFTQIVGCSPVGTGDILGRTHWDLPNVVLPDGGWADHQSHLAARWSFCDFEFAIVHPDGKQAYYSICGEPVYDEAHTFIGYCGTGVDITTRKRVELALRESESRWRAIAGPQD
jgi:PAS domain S-box-containing protein